MKRRQFVGTLGAAAALPLVPAMLRAHASGSVAPATAAASLKRIGLETYSVRDRMKADPDGTLRAVRDMGYTDVELLWSFNNFGRTTAQVKAVLTSTGLKAPSAHIAPEILLKDWNKSLDTANELGHQYLIVPSLPAETNTSLDAWRVWADRFNTAGEAARRAGLWLAFHNEPNHMKEIAHLVPYDLFISLTDPSKVRLQLDVGNMLLGGGDPMAYLSKFGARYHSFHIKDVVADRSHDTDLGTGIFDTKKFLAAVKELEGKPVYVEQEGSKDSLASAKRNLDYLKGLRF
jgi:sugar phosphate isomerase/epimerase